MDKKFDTDGWVIPVDNALHGKEYDDWEHANSMKTLGRVTISSSLSDESLLNVSHTNIQYKYNEDEVLEELKSYINATYGQHYSQNKFQATEFIIDSGHGIGFCIGNMMKYTQRYGRKGTPEQWRQDILKVIHYAIIQLYVHDSEHRLST